MTAEIDHVTDFGQIAAMGIMSTPALVIDNKVLLLLMKSIRNFWQRYWQIQRCGHCLIHWRRR